MLVTLGDGRVVECASGVTRLPPGPMPKVLASEVARPMAGKPAHQRTIDYVAPTMRGKNPEEHASVPVALWARFDSPALPERAAKATRRGTRRAA